MSSEYYDILWSLYDSYSPDSTIIDSLLSETAHKVYDGDMSMRAAKELLSNV